MIKHLLHCTLFVLLLHISYANAATLSGKLTDDKGEALPFSSVYVKGTTRGTTTNSDGYYSLELSAGQYEIVYRSIGYKMSIHQVAMGGSNVTLNVKLQPESMEIKEVTVSAAGEDPAYEIIRQAQKKRKFYLEQVASYSTDVYIKGVQRIKKLPKKIMGVEVTASGIGIIDSASGIVYLSESVSKFNFKQPSHVREEMVSSKVSGDNKAFSYNQASDMMFNFYENLIQVDNLSDRGFVSPISGSAMLYYKYKLIGGFRENGIYVNKIQVTPIRKNDPAFRGIIYITDDSWRIHSTELMLTKDADIDFVDTLVIKQLFAPVDKDVWMPISNRFEFDFKVLGIAGNGYFMGSFGNYVLNPDYPKNFFGNEVMKVSEEANKKDSSYWKESRPVPLTTEETKDYKVRDSIQAYRNSKTYLDSIDKKRNHFKPINILTGFTYRNRYKKTQWSIPSLLSNIQYNTVEGYRVTVEPSYRKRLEKNRYYTIAPSFRYGFANNQLNAKLEYDYLYKAQKFALFKISAGTDVVEYNQQKPVGELINSLYTLFDNQNLAKFYRKKFAAVAHQSELVNGVVLSAQLEYTQREAMTNSTYYKMVVNKDREYTSNNPTNPYNDAPAFETNNALLFHAKLTLNYKQKYYTRPNEKIIIGSKYPTLTVAYSKGFHGLLNSAVNYDLVSIGVDDQIKMGLLGTSKYAVSVGRFLNRQQVYFTDYKHFEGNQTFFSGFELTAFKALPYYQYSTTGQYVEAHYEHNFGGFLLNKFPLIRKLRFNEIGSVHFLSNDQVKKYVELSVGLQRGIIPFKVEFVTAFVEQQRSYAGLRIGITVR